MLLDFRTLFQAPLVSLLGGLAKGSGVEGGGKMRAEGGFFNREKLLCVHRSTERGTVWLSGRECCWKQFHTKCSFFVHTS